MTSTDRLLFERRGATATITFNRREARNALTWDMYEALYECCEAIDPDEGIRAVVLRGAGDAFVAGTDIRQFREFETGEDGVAYEKRMERVVGRLEEVTKPTLAVVDGAAAGAGLVISAACDLRICTPRAKFGVPIARTLGNCLSMENYARMVALVGPARTKEILLLARFVSAEEALAAGLVMEVVDPDALDRRVEELCKLLAEHAPVTMRTTKEAIRRLRAAGLPEGDDLVAEAFGSDDFHEGVGAFLERRAPRWTGR
ncbi:MAG: enoyl-CoA hydratase/isomerase family protein [Actinomycetota bacterium]